MNPNEAPEGLLDGGLPELVEAVATTGRSGETVLDRYRVLDCLGSGGMGEVYEAEHLALGCRFAIKFLRPELTQDPDFISRFRREAQAMALIRSDHIAGIVDVGTHGGTPFFVMERLYGEDLRRLLERVGPLPVPRALHLVRDACFGLRAVHRAGLVHRDLKPANLFVTRRDAGEDLCKILDFGVARSLTRDSTHRGSMVGTLRYMAPELLQGDGVAGPQSDIYALGAILYECLTGQALHTADTPERLAFKIMHENPPLSPGPQGEIPPLLSAVLSRALARDVADRFRTADAFAGAFARFIDPVSPNLVLRQEAELAKTHPDSEVRPWQTGLVATTRNRFFGVRMALLGALAVGVPWSLQRWQNRTRDVPVTPTSRSASSLDVHASSGPQRPDVHSYRVPPVPGPVAQEPSLAAPDAGDSQQPSAGRAHTRAVPNAPPRSHANSPLPRFDVANPYGK